MRKDKRPEPEKHHPTAVRASSADKRRARRPGQGELDVQRGRGTSRDAAAARQTLHRSAHAANAHQR